MTTLHMQTETVRTIAMGMRQSSEAMSVEIQALRESIQRLATIWDGGASDQFQGEAENLLRQLMQQLESLSILADRATREVQEWEDVDNHGAQSMYGLGSQIIFQSGSSLPFPGGLGSIPSYNNAILPLFTALSIIPFFENLPTWLDSFLNKFFAPSATVSPTAEIPTPQMQTPDASVTTPLGELNKQTMQAADESEKPANIQYDTSYDILPKSQGTLYGGAACMPTSTSMVLDHYHAQNPNNQTATPDSLIGMLDKGDGTWGNGIGLDKMNDDLAELGYTTTVSSGNMGDLDAALKDGPVIVNSQVGLVSSPARDILPNGSVNHAIVVKAINSDSVVVNDPWSGTEKIFSRPTFEKMWNGGSNYMIAIRPDGNAQ